MLHERLDTLIRTLGVKKGDFAQKVGFSQSYISMLLGGKRQQPSDRFFEAVLREYQVNISWLRDGTGDMFAIPDVNMTSSDVALLKMYKSLPLSEQKVIGEIVNAMLIKRLSENQQMLGASWS